MTDSPYLQDIVARRVRRPMAATVRTAVVAIGIVTPAPLSLTEYVYNGRKEKGTFIISERGIRHQPGGNHLNRSLKIGAATHDCPASPNGTCSRYGNPYLFTGREYDPESRLYNYRTRYLDPIGGRFITRDMIGVWGNPMELGNGNSFVGSAPWTLVDPFGLSGQPPKAPGPPEDWPKPPGHNQNWKWNPNKDPNPQPPADPGSFEDESGNRWRFHPEDEGHHPHWDVRPPKGSEGKQRVPVDPTKGVFKDPKKETKRKSGSVPRGAKGKIRGSITGGLAGIATGLIAEHAQAVQTLAGGYYQQLLTAISRGDFKEADRIARLLRDALIDQGLYQAAFNWEWYWDNVILPALTKAKAEAEASQDSRELGVADPVDSNPGVPTANRRDRTGCR